uniref:Uncharacterized protein n=1 Tax=Tanacetum cinerariifolium TaxID=118510 RepID=A0A6L2MM02_TANCI|nr:hypothetical protein [Tanacetum cinerariifolium]
MTSSIILTIYIQLSWDTLQYDSTTGIYSCQLDEQWFNLHKDILRDALQITPINDNDLFVAPPSSDKVIEYVYTLGCPCMLRNVSAMSVNELYQPWRAILSMINMFLMEFIQSIQSFFTDKKRLTMPSQGKKKTDPLLIPSIRVTKLIIHHLKTQHNIHPITGLPFHYLHKDNVLRNLKFLERMVGKYLQRYLDGEHSMADEEAVFESPKPRWDAKGFEYKNDYTIIESPCAVKFLVCNNERKIMRSKCENKGIVPPEMVLKQEQTQQDFSHEVWNIQVIPKYHSKDGNPARANIKQALGRSVLTGFGVKMEMEIPRSSGVYFIITCSYSTDTSKELMKAQVVMKKWYIMKGAWLEGLRNLGVDLCHQQVVSSLEREEVEVGFGCHLEVRVEIEHQAH